MARDIVTDQDVEMALGTYNELTVVRHGEEMSEMARLIHNDNLFSALVSVYEARLADQISTEDPKLAADKVKWKARRHPEFQKILVKAAKAAGELGAARLRIRAAENVIEIWRSQSANNRRGHL